MQNTSPILNHYQTWLDDFTRISLWHGLCQQELTQWHRPCLTPEGTVIVIPQCLASDNALTWRRRVFRCP